MFEDRKRLHEQGYQHKVVKIIDRMVVDILLLADKELPLLYRRNGRLPLFSL